MRSAGITGPRTAGRGGRRKRTKLTVNAQGRPALVFRVSGAVIGLSFVGSTHRGRPCPGAPVGLSAVGSTHCGRPCFGAIVGLSAVGSTHCGRPCPGAIVSRLRPRCSLSDLPGCPQWGIPTVAGPGLARKSSGRPTVVVRVSGAVIGLSFVRSIYCGRPCPGAIVSRLRPRCSLSDLPGCPQWGIPTVAGPGLARKSSGRPTVVDHVLAPSFRACARAVHCLIYPDAHSGASLRWPAPDWRVNRRVDPPWSSVYLAPSLA